jgi:hypothetical protein
MARRPVLAAAVLAWMLAGAGCGPAIDLSKLEVTEVFTGYYDNGIKDGWNHLLPSISFRLKNNGAVPVTDVQLSVAFWVDGGDGEKDSRQVLGIGHDALAPGAATTPILVRPDHGYRLEGPRSTLFDNSLFRDMTARIFGKRSGKIVRLGEFKIERRVLPHLN